MCPESAGNLQGPRPLLGTTLHPLTPPALHPPGRLTLRRQTSSTCPFITPATCGQCWAGQMGRTGAHQVRFACAMGQWAEWAVGQACACQGGRAAGQVRPGAHVRGRVARRLLLGMFPVFCPLSTCYSTSHLAPAILPLQNPLSLLQCPSPGPFKSPTCSGRPSVGLRQPSPGGGWGLWACMPWWCYQWLVITNHWWPLWNSYLGHGPPCLHYVPVLPV